MLNEPPNDRPNASQVWEHLKDMVGSLEAKPHCEHISPVTLEEETDDVEITVRENIVAML